jgi:type IV secretion system protein VirB3
MAARFPLYKGATRAATVLGVPMAPLVVMVGAVVFGVALPFGIWWLGLLLPCWSLMALVTRTDDRAFRTLGLWLETKVANGLWLGRPLRGLALYGAGRGRDLWGASTYALSDGRYRAWEGEDV